VVCTLLLFKKGEAKRLKQGQVRCVLVAVSLLHSNVAAGSSGFNIGP
jgi:hypothetical protein